jgi:hypothetical protein
MDLQFSPEGDNASREPYSSEAANGSPPSLRYSDIRRNGGRWRGSRRIANLFASLRDITTYLVRKKRELADARTEGLRESDQEDPTKDDAARRNGLLLLLSAAECWAMYSRTHRDLDNGCPRCVTEILDRRAAIGPLAGMRGMTEGRAQRERGATRR